MVNVIHEIPSQRMHHRVDAPLYVEVLNQLYKVDDWGLGGLRISHVKGQYPKLNKHVHLSVTLPFQGFNISFDIEGKVNRSDQKEKIVVIEFLSLGEREENLMQHFLDELIRGNMSSLEDTIQRIDTPVTLVPTTPSVNPISDVPVKRWPIKSLLISTLYLLLGAFVILYFTIFLYSQFYKLEVTTAVISAPIEVVSAVSDGRVAHTLVVEGGRVTAGEPVMFLYYFNLENERIENIRNRQNAEADVAQWEARLFKERDRIDDLGLITQSNIVRAQMEINAVMASLNAARAEEKRVKELFDKGWATASQHEVIASQINALEFKLGIARQNRLNFQQMSERSGNLRHFDGEKFQGELEDIMINLRRSIKAVQVAEQLIMDTERKRNDLDVKAPFNGIVRDIIKTNGSSINKGDIIAIFEKDSARIVEAWLNQEEVLELGIGDKAEIYSPALDLHFIAQVRKIDRTSSFVDEIQSSYVWRGPKDRTARVELEYLSSDPKFLSKLIPGVPVVVYFKRRTVNALWASFLGGSRKVGS